jgi:hypothetical protein
MGVLPADADADAVGEAAADADGSPPGDDLLASLSGELPLWVVPPP